MLLKQARKLRAIKHRAKPKKKDADQERNKPSGTNQAGQKPVEKSQTIDDKDRPEDEATNKGTLKMDATVAPQHIGYPTDTRLLHSLSRHFVGKARLYSEELIDKLYSGSFLWKIKPRTYRGNAHQHTWHSPRDVSLANELSNVLEVNNYDTCDATSSISTACWIS